jgi:hypothetical protein
LQLALQLNFWIVKDTCNSLYLYVVSGNGQVAWISKNICNSLYLYVVSANRQGAWVAKLQFIVYKVQPLGEKPHFSTMFLTISQLPFIVEKITFNYNFFFVTQKWCCQLISKIVDNVESTLQHSWKQRTCVNLWVHVEVITF